MKMQLVGIFDRKAQTFISLEPTPAIAVSVRQLTEVVNTQKENPICKWPEDYSLWHLGDFDTESGFHANLTDDNGWKKTLVIECESLKQRPTTGANIQ